MVDFNIYAGKAEGGVIQYGLGYDVVRKLMLDYEGQGYHLFSDNFYSSVTLARHLYERGILYTGTILETRRDFPASLKGSKEWAKKKARGAMPPERDPPVLALQWLDNKVVSMISSSAKANDKVQTTRKTKVAGVWDPQRRVDQLQIFRDYNRFMNAVDRSDQILATHTVHQKSMRWWKAFFFSMELTLLWSTLLSSSKNIKQGSQKMKDFSAQHDTILRISGRNWHETLPTFSHMDPPLYILM